jgi:hypothetical protein
MEYSEVGRELQVLVRWADAGLSWEALRWSAWCVDCDEGTQALAHREAVDEWRLRHREGRGHSVMVDCERDRPDGTLVRCSEE